MKRKVAPTRTIAAAAEMRIRVVEFDAAGRFCRDDGDATLAGVTRDSTPGAVAACGAGSCCALGGVLRSFPRSGVLSGALLGGTMLAGMFPGTIWLGGCALGGTWLCATCAGGTGLGAISFASACIGKTGLGGTSLDATLLGGIWLLSGEGFGALGRGT